MKPTDIDLNFIEIFNDSYDLASHHFGNPLTASPSKQKKIRKYIYNSLDNKNDYPKKVLKCIDKSLSDTEFLSFFKECADYIKENGTWAKQRFDKFSADLSEDSKQLLWQLIKSFLPIYSQFYWIGKDAALNVHYCSAYKITLILKNAVGIPNNDISEIIFEEGSFVKKEDGTYIIVGETYSDDTDVPSFCTIGFTDACVEYEVYDATKGIYSGTPWKYLAFSALDIYSKRIFPTCLLNDKEKEIWPLISELNCLEYYLFPIGTPPEDNKLPTIKSYVKKYGYSKIISLIEKFEKAPNMNKRAKISSKLLTILNNIKYEPLWRDIFSKIAESQSEYPSLAEKTFPKDTLKKTRINIQKLLEAYGYSGTYPDFYKKSSIRGLHLEEAYNMTYFVGMEKNSAHFIHCNEHFFNGNLAIEFLCGAALLKKGETADDIYSCAFNANGRRLIYTVEYNQDASEDIDQSELAMRAGIAVKKAELQKLNKQEKQSYLGDSGAYWQLFWYIFLFAGGLFAILFTLAFMIFVALSIFLAEGLESMLSCITDYPIWLLCFAVAWVGFGGLFGLVTVLAKRK